MFDAKKVTEQEPELRGKNCLSITDNRVGKAVVPYYYVRNYLHKSWSINSDFNWLIVHHFCQTVDNDENLVIAITFSVGEYRQTYNKVYKKVFLSIYRD